MTTTSKKQLKNVIDMGKGYNLKQGDNTKLVTMNLKLFNLPDINMRDPEQVQERISEYFSICAEYDSKPTVVGLGMALNGTNRSTLWGIDNDTRIGGKGYKSNLPPDVTNFIKKTYLFLETLWESYMVSGKINPASGIFLGKNHYGYKDVQEQVIKAETPQAADYSIEEIKKRYEIEGDTDDHQK